MSDMANKLTWVAVVVLAVFAGFVLSPQTTTLILGTKKTVEPDSDGDRVPDAVEQALCGRSIALQGINAANGGLGGCRGTNWVAPERVAAGAIPTGYTLGPDGDRDGFPSYVRLTRNELDINPFRGKVVLLDAAAPAMDVSIDPSDDDANMPALSERTVEADLPFAVMLGPDADYDGLPAYAKVQRGHLVFDRRAALPVNFRATDGVQHPVDSNDTDPEVPANSTIKVWLPVGAHHTTDADQDLIPGAITVAGTEITVDRRTNAEQRVTSRSTSKTIVLDANEADRNDRIPYTLVDADADFLPDGVESAICLVQDQFATDDGICVRSDGSGPDGSGANYVAPVGRPDPWSFR